MNPLMEESDTRFFDGPITQAADVQREKEHKAKIAAFEGYSEDFVKWREGKAWKYWKHDGPFSDYTECELELYNSARASLIAQLNVAREKYKRMMELEESLRQIIDSLRKENDQLRNQLPRDPVGNVIQSPFRKES